MRSFPFLCVAFTSLRRGFKGQVQLLRVFSSFLLLIYCAQPHDMRASKLLPVYSGSIRTELHG